MIRFVLWKLAEVYWGWTGQGPRVRTQPGLLRAPGILQGEAGVGGWSGWYGPHELEDVVKTTGSGPMSLGFITKVRSEEELPQIAYLQVHLFYS